MQLWFCRVLDTAGVLYSNGYNSGHVLYEIQQWSFSVFDIFFNASNTVQSTVVSNPILNRPLLCQVLLRTTIVFSAVQEYSYITAMDTNMEYITAMDTAIEFIKALDTAI